MDDMDDMDDPVVPKLGGWDFAARERYLFQTAPKQIPTWRLANQSRRHLADVLFQLSNAMEIPDLEWISELPATPARRLASTSLAGIVVRSTGAMINLVGCGYEREALAPFRVISEAVLRGLQLAADPSGDVARQILQGRRPGSLKTIAQKFGDEDEATFIGFLDRFAHPDPFTMLALAAPRAGEGAPSEMDLEVRPRRGQVRPANQLLMAAHATVKFSVILSTEAFNRPIVIPTWIRDQLKHYKDNPLPEIA